MLLFVGAGLFAQNVSLDQAVQTSAQAIETRLPKGAKTAVLTFTSAKQAFSDYIIEELAIALSLNKNLQLIDRQHMEAIRKEFNVQFSGDVSDEEVKSIGKQLGAQYVVTGSIVDIGNAYRFRVAAINVESAVREGSPPLNININDPQVVFLLTGQRPAPVVTPSSNTENEKVYKVGDIGPGGGRIFFAGGGDYKECIELLSKVDMSESRKYAEAYRGGGFDDWRIPTEEEIDMIYRNLKRYFNGWVFFSKPGKGARTALNFNNGQKKEFTYINQHVIAVREFW
jgi:TolB-like protein